ncbi:MAG: hypothetical protein OD811_05340, partial [Alphaproteobacteria bacterium]
MALTETTEANTDATTVTTAATTDTPAGGEASRALPTNEGAELAILSGVLANNEALVEIEDLLRGEHFSVSLLGRLYDTCARLFAVQRLANATTLAESFNDDSELEAYGGLSFLQELQESWIQLSDLRDYARVVRDAHMRRCLA